MEISCFRQLWRASVLHSTEGAAKLEVLHITALVAVKASTSRRSIACRRSASLPDKLASPPVL